MTQECVFCKIADKTIPSTIKYEDEDFIAFDDIKPNAPVHILLIPKRHFQSIADLGKEESKLAESLILIANKIAKDHHLTNGYRLVTNSGPDSGQEVAHLHLHILGGKRLGPIG